MLQNDPNKRFEFEDKPVATVLTGLLIFMMILVYPVAMGGAAPQMRTRKPG